MDCSRLQVAYSSSWLFRFKGQWPLGTESATRMKFCNGCTTMTVGAVIVMSDVMQ